MTDTVLGSGKKWHNRKTKNQKPPSGSLHRGERKQTNKHKHIMSDSDECYE